MFDSSNTEYAEESSTVTTSSTKLNADLRDFVFEQLHTSGLIGYGKTIPIQLIRKLANLPEPSINGMDIRSARKAIDSDNLFLLGLRDQIFDKHLMRKGMALKQCGENWYIPSKREMPQIWKSYANKASNALTRARWLIRSAPAPSGEDMAFAQNQAARVARQVAKLTEQAAKIG